MIVTTDNVSEVINTLLACDRYSVDSETTSILPFKETSRLFSIIIGTKHEVFYFNFQDYPNEGIEKLPDSVFVEIKKILGQKDKTFFLQNACFDMAFLAKHDIYILGKIYDLKFLDRIHWNQHMKYSLDEISKRWGSHKEDIAKKYVEDNKLAETVAYPEFNKEESLVHYELVPFEIMSKYAIQDGKATLEVGEKILQAIMQEDASVIEASIPKQMTIVENEARLVHTLFKMQNTGITVDLDYCREAKALYQKNCEIAAAKFKDLTGIDFVKGTTVFEEVFASEKEKWRQTDRGNWQWNKKVLSKFTNPAAGIAGEYAEAKKQLEYFENFLWFADKDGIIHPKLDQAGTKTGRFSSYDPNFQNLTSPDKYDEDSESSEFPIRKALIPRPGFFFVMIDYAQSEFRLFLEYAKAIKLINEVNAGKDLHQANAEIAGVTRKQAKTIGFGLLYGQGIGTLTQALYDTKGDKAQVGSIYKHMIRFGITPDDVKAYATCTPEIISHDTELINKAVAIKKAVLHATPEFKFTMDNIKKAAENRGYIRNFYGRRLQFPDKRFSYQATNHLIQSSCADMLKIAMNKIDDLLLNKKTKMLLQIHDELVIHAHPSEIDLIPKIKAIMEEAFPYRLMPQVAEVSYGNNLADKRAFSEASFTSEQETRNSI